MIMKLLKSDVGIIAILTMVLFALVKSQDASANMITAANGSAAAPTVISSSY